MGNGGRERDRVTATDSNDTTSLGLVFRAKPPQKYNQLDTCDEENVTSSQSTRNKPKRNSRKHSLSYSIYFYLFWIFALFWPFLRSSGYKVDLIYLGCYMERRLSIVRTQCRKLNKKMKNQNHKDALVVVIQSKIVVVLKHALMLY